MLFDLYTYVLLSGKEVSMTPEVPERFSEANEEFSSRALRVLALNDQRRPPSSPGVQK
ncbi:Calcium-transporting ATPase [compost metagenome]